MSHLEMLYPAAIEHTKEKVWEDLYCYLGDKEICPSFDQYLQDRTMYLEQIWINVWLNLVSNKVPRSEKKEFLSSKGYEVEGVDRKLINHSFRQEIRDYQTFDVLEWVQERLANRSQEWEELYQNARKQFLEAQERERLAEKRTSILQRLEVVLDEILTDEYELFYIHIRHLVAKKLVEIFAEEPRYEKLDPFALETPLKKTGDFHAKDYTTLTSFYEELTGGLEKTRHKGRILYYYEDYGSIFESCILENVKATVPQLIQELVVEEMGHGFENLLGTELDIDFIEEFLEDELYEIAFDFVELFQEEYVEDLLKLAEVPFDVEVHQDMLNADLARREQRKEAELAEVQRKKEEEARRIEYIFGQEYQPGNLRDIRYILHVGETNTGKTHHALEQLKKSESGLYLAPLRLLALEVYDKLNADGVPCTLKTGEEEKVVPDAKHFSCTVEMFHEKDYFDVVVIDEAQMIADRDRGFSWYKAITKANAREVHIVGSRNLKSMIVELLGDAHIEVKEYTRDIPLQVERKLFTLQQTKKGDALVCFSRRRVLETASRLQNDGFSVSMIYGSMPPETRKKEMQRFIDGETKVIVATDAIGMGLNLPIRRIVFLETEKFDGVRRRRLSSQEVKQIAGRAGRKGIYDVGKVAFTNDIKIMKQLLQQEDVPVHTFAIAPTNAVFERFQKYYRDLGTFFELWKKFESPKGTKKAALAQERELYELIRGTEIEARLSMMDLYGFLHLPFSTKDDGLVYQWRETMFAIVRGEELPEPVIKKRNLDEQELSYKAIGLHLLFLYRLEKRIEATYWERVREELSDAVHKSLKTEVKKMTKKCRRCGRVLSWEHPFQICDPCHFSRYEF